MEWKLIDFMDYCSVPKSDHGHIYTSMRVKHPYEKKFEVLKLCAERRLLNSSCYVANKTFIEDYLRSGKLLHIYPYFRDFDLHHNLIYLDFIFDILGEKLQKEVSAAKKSYLAEMNAKLRVSDTGDVGDTGGVDAAGDDNVDYY